MRLTKELSESLRLSVKTADAGEDMIALAKPRRISQDTMGRALREVSKDKGGQTPPLKDWFDTTRIDEQHPLRPVRVWDDAVSQGVDNRFDNWWEKPRKYLQLGPGTTSYDTSRYKPNGAGDYIIAFGGAGSGRESSYGKNFDQFYGGSGNVARFTYNQLDDAIKYARGLPKGSRLFVTGHSMGGHAALKFADRLKELGAGIAGMDLRDPVRMEGRWSSYGRKLNPFAEAWMTAPSNVTYGINTYNPGWVRSGGDLVSLIGSRINALRNGGDRFINVPAPRQYEHTEINGLDLTRFFPADVKWLMRQIQKRKAVKQQEVKPL